MTRRYIDLDDLNDDLDREGIVGDFEELADEDLELITPPKPRKPRTPKAE